MKPQMTLGEFIRALERQDPDEPVKYDFVHFGPTTLASYRGDYSELALGYNECGRHYPKVKDLIAHCKDALGKTFTGWKGGDYDMDERTPLWVANPGESGSTAIINIENRVYVTIITESRD